MKATKANVKEQIKKLSGNLSAVARSFGKSRGWIYLYVQKNDLQDEVDEARETMLDNVESKLYSEALAGNTTAMIFFLKTQGKKRGYIERQELTGKDGGAVEVKHDNKTYDRAISSLAEAIGKSIPGQDAEQQSTMDASERSTVGSVSDEG